MPAGRVQPSFQLPDAARPLVDVATRLVHDATDLRVPFLMMDRDLIAAHVARWRRHLPRVGLHYAVKVNSDPVLLAALLNWGCGFDAASAREMLALHHLGVPGGRVLLSHPAKDTDAVEVMARYRPWAFVTESEKEFAKLTSAGIPSADYDPVVFVRLRVTGKKVKQDLSAKFGRSPGKIAGIMAAGKAAGFKRFGIAFHVGTQCYMPESYAEAVATCLTIGRDARAAGLDVRWIDIGGGVCDGPTAARHGTTHDAILAAIARAVAPAISDGYEIVGEPGRYIVADAGTLVARIISQVVSDDTMRKLLINDGIYGGFSSQWNDARPSELVPFRLNSSNPLLAEESLCVIWGGTCDSIDRLDAESPYLMPINLDVGDYVVAPGSGAYTASAGSNFNGMMPPGVVLYWRESGSLAWQLSPAAKRFDVAREFLPTSTG